MRLKLAIFLLIACGLAAGQNLSSFQQWCQLGGRQITLQGMNSTNYAQTSYPLCQVEVFLAGTTTDAAIFSDNLSTPTPLSNPFHAGTDASFFFYAAGACYDITISSGTDPRSIMPTPYTFSHQCIGTSGGGGGGGGSVTNFAAVCSGASSILSCSVANPSTTPQLTITSALTLSGNASKLLTAGTLSGTGSTLCTDASGNATTSGCATVPVTSVFGRTGTVTAQSGDYSVAQVTGAAPLASPALTGSPTAPTATLGDSSTLVATTAFVKGQNYLTSAVTSFNSRTGAVTPTSGDYSVGQITGAAPLVSPIFTGTPTGPTPSSGDNSTNLATTAFVKAQNYLTASGAVISFDGRVGSVLFAPGDGPTTVASTVQTAKTSAITTTNLFTTGVADASYRVGGTVYCETTSAAATATLTVTYTDPSNTVQTITGTGAACATLGASSFQVVNTPIRAKAGTNIQYAVAIANTPTYDVSVQIHQTTTN